MTTYDFDNMSRPSGVQDPSGNVWPSVYDNRDLVAKMDPKRNLIASAFDQVRRQSAGLLGGSP